MGAGAASLALEFLQGRHTASRSPCSLAASARLQLPRPLERAGGCTKKQLRGWCGRALHSGGFLEGSDQHHKLNPTATPWGVPLLHPNRQREHPHGFLQHPFRLAEIPASALGWHWKMPPTGLGPPARGAHAGCGGHLGQTTAGTQQGHTSARAHPCANPLLGPMGLRAPTARHLPVPPEPLGNPRVPGTVMPTWARTSPVPTAPSPSLLPRHSALSLSRSSSLFPEQLPGTYLWHSQHFQKHIKMKEQICLAGQEEGKQTAPVHTQCPGWDSWPGLC